MKAGSAFRFLTENRIVTLASLQALKAARRLEEHVELDDILLARIREGASASPFLREECREVLRRQSLIEE